MARRHRRQIFPRNGFRITSSPMTCSPNLLNDNPRRAGVQVRLAGFYMNMARRQKGAESLASFEQARQILAGSSRNIPAIEEFGRDLAAPCGRLPNAKARPDNSTRAGQLGVVAGLARELNRRFPNYQDVVQKLSEARASLKQLDEQHPRTPRPNASSRNRPLRPSRKVGGWLVHQAANGRLAANFA